MVATFDWIVLGVLLLSAVVGLWRGLVYEVLSALSWIAAFILAQWFAPAVAERLPMTGLSEPLRYAAGFVLVFIGGLFAGGLLALLTKKMIEAVGLRPVDRMMGGIFGLVRGTVLVLALAVVVHLARWNTGDWWLASFSGGVATAALRGLKPVVPERFGTYLPA